MKQEIQTLLDEQLASWEVARNNYAALTQVKEKELTVNGIRYRVQCNPARILSSAAKVDARSIQDRKCFLCPAHLPAEQQGLPFKADYQILINPFPIFPRHLTVPALEHTAQRIQERFGDMLDLAAFAEEYVVFYNGPRCGASAPDHVHFQLGNKGFLPIEQDWKQQKGEKVGEYRTATLRYLEDAPRTTLLIEATEREDAVELFHIIYKAMEWKANEKEWKADEEELKADEKEWKTGEKEPMMNLLVWMEAGRWVICLFPRATHRPACYAAEGEAHILISPATVDMGGVLITPREEDFEKLTAADVATILSDVCLSPDEFGKLKQRIKELL